MTVPQHMPHSGYPMREILLWIWRRASGFRLQTSACIGLGICSVLLGFLFVWFTKLCVDIATGSYGNIRLIHAGSLLAGIALLQTGLSALQQKMRTNLTVRFQNHLQHDTFRRFLYSRHLVDNERHSGDITNRLGKDINDTAAFVIQTFPSAATTMFQLAGAFAFLFWLNATLGFILLLLVPASLLLSKCYVQKMRRLTHDIRTNDSRIQSLVQESIQRHTVIKALNCGDQIMDKLSDRHSSLLQTVTTKTRYSLRASMLLNAGFAAGYLTTFLWGTFQLQEGVITYGSLMAFVQLVGQIQGPARSMTRFIPLHISALTAADRLMQLEDTPQEAEGSTLFEGPVGICCEDITFAYAGGEPVFRNFSYTFAPGSCTAIIGKTGCGKTTLTRLLFSISRQRCGKIWATHSDGSQRVELSPLTRINFAYVPQGNTLFSGTIKENLRIGNSHADEEQMTEALKTACADFVFDKPLGLDTPCFEQGGGLSEGEAQRICIARALLQPGNILLLDEATSALDVQTEMRVIENILAHDKTRTVLFITHRKAALPFCSHVLDLEAVRLDAVSV